jgi:histidinol-phosphatase (PHP family)
LALKKESMPCSVSRQNLIPDYHIHTFHSGDNKELPEKCCEKAFALGFKEICFTDHFEPDPSSFLHNRLDIDKYYKHISRLKDQWAGRLNIKIGVETGWSQGFDNIILDTLAGYGFDMLMGSIHYVNNMSTAYAPELYPLFNEHPDFRAVLDPFFEALYRSVDSGLFSVIGHADLIFTHACVHYKNLSWECYKKEVESIVELAVKKDILFEINTGGLRCGFCDTTPESWFLKQYYQAGGRTVVFGSDAHAADDIGSNFDKALKIVTDLGFEYYAVFDSLKYLRNKLPG